MSRSAGTSSLKRGRAASQSPGQMLIDSERAVLGVIKSKKDMGISTRDINQETKLSDAIVKKAIKSLLGKKLIKEVVNIQNKGRKHYMAAEYEPSKEVSGGAWYVEGNLDKELVGVLKDVCLKIVRSMKVASVDGVYDFVKKSRAITFELSSKQVAEILNSMVLDNVIIEVESTGIGDYHSIPLGTICYRVAPGGDSGKGARTSAMASIPCGVCPRISQCTPDGVISPATCVYYTKWLDIDY